MLVIILQYVGLQKYAHLHMWISLCAYFSQSYTERLRIPQVSMSMNWP